MGSREDLRTDQRAPGGAKKLIESSLLEIVQAGMTSDEWVIAINTAKLVNEALGGPFVAPWEVKNLPDELVERILALANDLPGMKEGQKRVEEIRAKWLNSLKH